MRIFFSICLLLLGGILSLVLLILSAADMSDVGAPAPGLFRFLTFFILLPGISFFCAGGILYPKIHWRKPFGYALIATSLTFAFLEGCLLLFSFSPTIQKINPRFLENVSHLTGNFVSRGLPLAILVALVGFLCFSKEIKSYLKK